MAVAPIPATARKGRFGPSGRGAAGQLGADAGGPVARGAAGQPGADRVGPSGRGSTAQGRRRREQTHTQATQVLAPQAGIGADLRPPDAWTLDRLAVRLRSATRILITRTARAAHRIEACEAWKFYCYARLSIYAEVEHHRDARWFQNWAKLAEGMDRFPQLEAAVLDCNGRHVGAVAATEVARIANESTVAAWMERARRVTVRELKEEIRARRAAGETAPGPEPGEPGDFLRRGKGTPRDDGAPGNHGAPLDDGAPGSDAAGGDDTSRNDDPTCDDDALREENASLDDSVPWGMSASRTTLEDDDPDLEARVLVGFEVPRKVALAFQDGLDLHRAVTGSETTMQSFVEALCAESAAGLAPPDCLQEPLVPGDYIARAEHAMARITNRWAQLIARDGRGASASTTSSCNSGTPAAGVGAAASASASTEHNPGAAGSRPIESQPSESRPGESRPAESRPAGSASNGRGAFAANISTDAVEAIAAKIVVFEQQAEAMLAILEATPSPECSTSLAKARAAHEELQQLLQLEDGVERCLGRLLYLMSLRGDFATLGFASLGHYAVERLYMPRRTAEWRAGILRALRRLPRICEAYEAGDIGLETAWELYDILKAKPCSACDQDRWIAHAKEISVRRLREEARALKRQELESTEAPAAARPGAEITPGPRPATDPEWLASLYRAPGDTRGRFRRLQLPGVDDPMATLTDLRRTDRLLRCRLPVDIADVFRGALEATRRRLTELARAQIAADEHLDTANRSAGQAAPASLRAARAFLERERRIPTWVALLALLEDYAETHDNPAGFPVRRWDPVYCRYGWICRVPHCTVRVGIEDHHLVYRSHNGTDELYNQVSLCPFHHRQGEHGDFMRCWGTAPDNIHWAMGAPEIATRYLNERRVKAA